jgi:hypothetical protein
VVVLVIVTMRGANTPSSSSSPNRIPCLAHRRRDSVGSMSDPVAAAAIAGASATLGAAVPIITTALTNRGDRDKAFNARAFEADRDWERYRFGLGKCYEKFFSQLETAELADEKIKADDLDTLRRTYNEVYFAGDPTVARLLSEYWPDRIRDRGVPPHDAAKKAELREAMKAQTLRSRIEEESLRQSD